MARIEHQIDVVGLGFRMKRDAREVLAASLKSKPLKVTLEREPTNKYDPNAIKVIAAAGEVDGIHLGYVRATTAEVLAPRIDDGTLDIISAKLITMHERQDHKEGVMAVEMEDLGAGEED